MISGGLSISINIYRCVLYNTNLNKTKAKKKTKNLHNSIIHPCVRRDCVFIRHKHARTRGGTFTSTCVLLFFTTQSQTCLIVPPRLAHHHPIRFSRITRLQFWTEIYRIMRSRARILFAKYKFNFFHIRYKIKFPFDARVIRASGARSSLYEKCTRKQHIKLIKLYTNLRRRKQNPFHSIRFRLLFFKSFFCR